MRRQLIMTIVATVAVVVTGLVFSSLVPVRFAFSPAAQAGNTPFVGKVLKENRKNAKKNAPLKKPLSKKKNP